MKHKANRLLSFIFALVLMAGLLPISVFATGNNYKDYDLGEALDAYKKFTEEEYHEDEWVYTIERFGLYDLNHDGVPELFTLGGGQMDYSKIFTYKNKQVNYVHWGASFKIYDNGIVYVDFSSGDGYILYSYYTMGDDLSLKLVFRFAEWSSLEDTKYSIGEQAYDENSEKVSYQQVAEQREKIIGNAQIVNIVYHDNTASERNAVFTNETSVASGSDTTRFESFFEAYLGLLESRKQLILDSGKLSGAPERAVAIADVCGDQTPELIFAAANEDSYFRNTSNGPLVPMRTDLFIYTFDNGELWQIYNCGYDFMAASGSHTRLFQSGVGKELWIASGYGDTYWDETYKRLSYDPDKKDLSELEIFHSRGYYQEDRYDAKHDEQTISEHEYTAAIKELEKDATSWIISSRNSTYWEQYTNDQHDYIAMTYDEAVAYLNANRDISITFNDYTALFSNSLFAEPSSNSNPDLALLSGILSWAVYHDTDKPTIKEVYSMLGISEKDIFDNSDERDKDLRFSIAKKTIYVNNEKTNLLIIVARGTVNEALRDHYTKANSRFLEYNAYDLIYEFQEDIREELVNFCNTHEELENTPLKVLVTGHSLGGAAANLVAANFTYYADRSSWWSEVANKDDIFCYTFGAIDSIKTDGTVSEGYENIHNIYNWHDNFGKYGWVLFSAAGNSIYGKFGHIDFFYDDRDKGSLTTIQNHDMGTYLDAVVGKNTRKIYYCHKDSAGSKLASAHCPVDVAVYKGSELVGQIINNEVVENVTKIPMLVVDDSKYALLSDAEEYRIEIKATDRGVMQFSCRDAATGNDAKTFADVALEAGKTMNSTVSGDAEMSAIKLYVVSDKGASIAEVQEDGTEIAVNQNSIFLPVIIGIGALVLIGLVILFLWKRQNRNKNMQ